MVYRSYEHVPFHIRGLSRFLTVAGYYRKWWCINKLIIKFIIELGIWVIRACAVLERGLLPFLTAAGYYRKWWCFNTLIMIFIIELDIWQDVIWIEKKGSEIKLLKKSMNMWFLCFWGFIMAVGTQIMQKIIKKLLSGYFLAYPPKCTTGHQSAVQCTVV